jgi:hypothetical protein
MTVGGDYSALEDYAGQYPGLRTDYEGAHSDVRAALQEASGASGDPGVAMSIDAVDERVFFTLATLPEVISVTGGIVQANASNLRGAFG